MSVDFFNDFFPLHLWFENRGRSRCSGCFHQTFPETFDLSPSGRQLHIYSRITNYSFGSNICLLLKEKSFLILSDSLSSLKAIFNLKCDHPILVQILELYMDLTKDGKDIVFIWIPGHVGIRGNWAADPCWRHLG